MSILRLLGLACLVSLILPFPSQAQMVLDMAHAIPDVTESEVTFSASKTTTTYTFRSTSQQSFNGVLVEGQTSIEDLTGEVRFLDDATATAWMPLRFLESNTVSRFVAGARTETYRESGVIELRFNVPTQETLQINQIGIFDNRLDSDWQVAQTTTPRPALFQSTSTAIIPPALIPRRTWGAEDFRGTPVPLAQPVYTRMTFHHAACCGAESYEEGLQQVKFIQDFHQDVRGWSDIGYHFLLDQQGRIYQGRPFLDNRTNLDSPPVLAQGAHVGGFNTGNIGVSMLGCYHPPEGGNCLDTLSPATRDSLATVFAYLSERYGVATPNLLGHRDQGNTACPGDNNYRLLPDLRVQINELIATGNAPIARASLSASSTDEGVVLLEGSFQEVFDVASVFLVRIQGRDSTTVYTTDQATDFQYVDPGASQTIPTQYNLFATSSTGRQQRLATAFATINDPDRYLLTQNFPNPFSAQTTVRYYLPREGIVRLELFTLDGKRILMLANGFQDGDRWYSETFAGSGLASGIYFIRLLVEGFSGIDYSKTITVQVVH